MAKATRSRSTTARNKPTATPVQNKEISVDDTVVQAQNENTPVPAQDAIQPDQPVDVVVENTQSPETDDGASGGAGEATETPVDAPAVEIKEDEKVAQLPNEHGDQQHWTTLTDEQKQAINATGTPPVHQPAVVEDVPAQPAVRLTDTHRVQDDLKTIDPQAARMNLAQKRQRELAENLLAVKKLPTNIAAAKAKGEYNAPEKAKETRPKIFNSIDKVMLPFVEKMMPGVNISDQEAGSLHYSVAMLIRSLLIIGGADLKIGIPYLFGYYNRYANSVFHPQNHHRGVGLMRGTENDINFYRNVSRLFVDLSNPKSAELVLKRTDIAHFKRLTMDINSPAAAKIAENLATVISRSKTPD